MVIPYITEIFVTVSGHYAVGYYTMKILPDRRKMGEFEDMKKEELRLSFQMFFHLATCLSILATEFIKHNTLYHHPDHVIDRKTFKENFIQFLPMYRPGGPLGGPPHTWRDDWKKK